VRILHITRNFPPATNGGISTAVGELVEASIDRGIDVGVISFDRWRPRVSAESYGTPLRQLGNGVTGWRINSPDQLTPAASWAAEYAPSVIHLHHSMLWEFADSLRQRCDAHLVTTVHVLQAELDELRQLTEPTLSSRAERSALEASDLITAPSEFAANRIRAQYPELEDRVQTLPPGIAITPRADAAATTASTAAAPTALYIGRFADVKGTAELLEVIPRILERVPTVKVVVAGGLPENPKVDRRWRRRFDGAVPQAFAHRFERFEWLDAAGVMDQLERATVLLAPSRIETLGLSVLEAMTFGVPAASTRCGGVESLVDHGVSGLLSAPRDIDALVENAVSLLADVDLANELGRNAAALARRDWTWSTRFDPLRRAYTRLG
jgi:glycosyltransferase involved in cell wall biosynthesis